MKSKLGKFEFLAILLIVVVTLSLLLPALKKTVQAKERASCVNNLKQIGLVMKMYSNEAPGEKFPRLSPVRDNWMFDLHAVYPEYMRDLSILIDPASPFAGENAFRSTLTGELDPDCVSGLFYNYTSYLITGDAGAMALYDLYESMDILEFRELDHNLTVPVWKKRYGISGLAVIWDRVPLVESEFSHHGPFGGNVLMLDGHVEFVEYSHFNNPSFFPFTRVGAEIFGGVQPDLPRHCF